MLNLKKKYEYIEQLGTSDADVMAACLHYHFPVAKPARRATTGCCNTTEPHTHDAFGRRRALR